ncbi:MAG: sulfite exporter TauE/SafE family protein [Reinekea sp.]|nr:sulfite exporter TauE/SafE family protein [Reinekea sp.]
MELSWFMLALLTITGFVAGVINTLAGGGSNLTLPALMILGLPADVANATNRVGVLMQSLVGMRGFNQHGQLPLHDLKGILLPVLGGGLLGSSLASYLPPSLLKPVLLGTMISMSVVILFRPSTVFPGPDEQSLTVKESSGAWWILFIAGIYGGFVQAGVGFVLIAAIGGSLRYDLVKTNALKMLCTAAFTSVALVVFIARGQVAWLPGIVLAMATMVGARVGVRLALRVSQRFMKWFLFLMTVAASLAALL